MDDVIIDTAAYGEHIELCCENHPDKRWSTKNIGYIGARKIFYNLDCVAGMGEECDCPADKLKPL